MTDLASFLLARLDEEEFVARAAGGNRWAMMADLDEVAVFAERKPGDETPDGKGWDDVAYWRRGDNVEGIDLRLTDIVPFADHIARHNPARVLADIEAKRRIVELHDGDDPYLLSMLAFPYAQHPDYEAWMHPDDPGWKP